MAGIYTWAPEVKVFWFFSSEKNILPFLFLPLSLVCWPCSLAPALPKANEINRLQENGRKAAFTGDVGEDGTCKGKEQAGAFDEQERLDRFRRHAIQREDAGVLHFRDEDRAAFAAILHRFARFGFHGQNHLVNVLAILKRAGLNIEVDGHLGLAAQCRVDLGGVRHFEG